MFIHTIIHNFRDCFNLYELLNNCYNLCCWHNKTEKNKRYTKIKKKNCFSFSMGLRTSLYKNKTLFIFVFPHWKFIHAQSPLTWLGIENNHHHHHHRTINRNRNRIEIQHSRIILTVYSIQVEKTNHSSCDSNKYLLFFPLVCLFPSVYLFIVSLSLSLYTRYINIKAIFEHIIPKMRFAWSNRYKKI